MAGYGDDAGFSAWLAENGYSLPGDAPTPAVLRQRGSQYVDSVYGLRLLGGVTDPLQERQFPRVGAAANGRPLPSDVVPLAVIHASYYAAYFEAQNPGSLSVIGSAASTVTREKVGQLEVQYASAQSDGTAISFTPLISIVDGMMAPFMRDPQLVYFGAFSIGGC